MDDARDFVTAEAAAAADDVTPTPMDVASNDSDVLIVVDAATARELATAWSVYHAEPTQQARRPRWHDDVVGLVTAAAYADMATGRARVVRSGFHLTPVPTGNTNQKEQH